MVRVIGAFNTYPMDLHYKTGSSYVEIIIYINHIYHEERKKKKERRKERKALSS